MGTVHEDEVLGLRNELDRLRRIVARCEDALGYDMTCDYCTKMPEAENHREDCAYVMLADEADNIEEWEIEWWERRKDEA